MEFRGVGSSPIKSTFACDRYNDIAADVRCTPKTIQGMVNLSTRALPTSGFGRNVHLTSEERDIT